MSRILAGPWAAQVLGDLGAEVIKVERPGSGDDTRHWGPPYLKDALGDATGEAAYYLCANRNKQSITVDITLPEGQEIIRRLIPRCDVMIENYKLGGLRKYGLDYTSLRALNPGLVYCSITGFGQTGPYAHRAGYDFLIQGMGGLMSITGEPDTKPGGGPVKVGVAVTDLFTGLYAAIGIQAALLERQRTGEGKHIDLALLDTCVAILANQATNYLVGGMVPQRLGNAHPNIVPYQAFSSADGHLILAVGNDQQFARFCDVAARPELAADPRYASNPARVANRAVLWAEIAAVKRSRSTTYWINNLETAGVPCGPINSIDAVFSDPQILARNMIVATEHPFGGTVRLPGNPIKFAGEEPIRPVAPPTLGSAATSVLRDLLGYEEAVLKDLRARGVI